MLGAEETLITIVARFADPVRAEVAKSTIEEMLKNAEVEVDALFEKQGGIADIADVADIYTRFGFHNDIGWKYEIPIALLEEEIIWELPEGLIPEEAQILLLALGAEAISVQTDDENEQWRQARHPGAMLILEDDHDFWEYDDEESTRPSLSIKRTLH